MQKQRIVNWSEQALEILGTALLQNRSNMAYTMLSSTEMIVRCKEDNWKIFMTDAGLFHLYHNNYVMVSDTERRFTNGYHDQKIESANLQELINYIAGYSWDKHLLSRGVEIDKTIFKLRIIENGEISRAISLKRTELNEYTFIPFKNHIRDIQDFDRKKKSIKKLMINILLDGKKSTYELICAIDEEEKSIYIAEGIFNVYWEHIQGEKVDMSQMCIYGKKAFVGRDNKIQYTGILEPEQDSQNLIRRRNRAMDPLSKYSEICSKMSNEKDASMLYEQVIRTAEDNIKIIENCKNNILILPLRLFNQSSRSDELMDVGKQAFCSLFEDINTLSDYFEKCVTIQNIVHHARKDIGELVLFSECDDRTLPLDERFNRAMMETEYMVDDTKHDSYNFFILVFGCIQQAIDVILSCTEYQCVPYIRYPVALHYVSLLSENMKDIAHIEDMRYKMSVAFVLYRLCNKEVLGKCDVETFLRKNNEFHFNDRLFESLEKSGINKSSFLNYNITKMMLDLLSEFYEFVGIHS